MSDLSENPITENAQVQEPNENRVNKTTIKDRIRGYLAKFKKAGSPEQKWKELAELNEQEKILVDLEQNLTLYERCANYLQSATGQLRQPETMVTIFSIGLGALSMISEAPIDPKLLAYISAAAGAGALAYGKTPGGVGVKAGSALAGAAAGVGLVEGLPIVVNPHTLDANTASFIGNIADDTLAAAVAGSGPAVNAARGLYKKVSPKKAK